MPCSGPCRRPPGELCITKYTRAQTQVKRQRGGLGARSHSLRRARQRVRCLLRLDVGLADDLAPLLRVAGDAHGEFLGRTHDRIDEARLQHALAEVRIGEDAPGLRVELVDNLARGVLGGYESVPGAGLVAG